MSNGQKNSGVWRILQPVLLGSLANIIVNYVFNPSEPDFFLDEFVVAILLSVPITELNFHIDRRLEKSYSWTRSFTKRFFLHLGLLTFCTLFVLNVIGNLYIWLTVGNDFYSFGEMLVINLSLFLVLFLMTFFNWGVSFYRKWKKTERTLEHSQMEIEKLSTNLKETSQEITFQQGKKQIKVAAAEVLIAKSEHGIVRVWTKEGSAIFSGTLQNLQLALPDSLFFPVSRNVSVQREMIKSISSSTYGKVDVEIKDQHDKITVSRQKASSFRKWYKSGSVE